MADRSLSDFDSLRDDDPIKSYLEKEVFPLSFFMKTFVQPSSNRVQEIPDYQLRKRVLNTVASMLINLRKEFSDKLELKQIMYYPNQATFNSKFKNKIGSLTKENISYKVSESNQAFVLVLCYHVNEETKFTDNLEQLRVPKKDISKISLEKAIMHYNQYINDYNVKAKEKLKMLSLPLEESLNQNEFRINSKKIRAELLKPPEKFNIEHQKSILDWVLYFDEVCDVIKENFKI